jgi:hypothetical protein
MSVSGTSRHSAAAQQFGRCQVEADVGPDFMIEEEIRNLNQEACWERDHVWGQAIRAEFQSSFFLEFNAKWSHARDTDRIRPRKSSSDR